ncbi:XrtA system polysaccharide chain length determinant [Thermodesulfobacteriota bacterium]
MEESNSINLHKYWDIATRKKWAILVPTLFGIFGAIGLCIVAPKAYKSTTLILVEPQKIPEHYVQSTVTIDAVDRLSTLSQQVLSRTRLERVIMDLDLYGDDWNEENMEWRVALLGRNIIIDIDRAAIRRRGGGMTSFSISFQNQDPLTAMRVTSRLADLFIKENAMIREEQAKATSEFLDQQLIEMKVSLEHHEEDIKQFKEKYMGELPEQLEANLRALDRFQDEKKSTMEALQNLEQRRILLRQQLTEYRPSSSSDGGPSSLYGQLIALKAELTELESRYTARYPDIIRIRKEIEKLEQRIKDDGGEETGDNSLMDSDPVYTNLKRQYDIAVLDINAHKASIASLDREIGIYQARVENTPKREQLLSTLTRDYEDIKNSYSVLLNKKLDAAIAEDLEKVKQGEQFRILDPANLPRKPSQPNQPQILLVGLLGGIFLGFGLALALEFLNNSFREVDELKSIIGLPVLTVIPKITSPREEMLVQRERALFLALAACGILSFLGYFVWIFLGLGSFLGEVEAASLSLWG